MMALFFNRKIEKKDVFALFLGAIGVLTILNVWSFSLDTILSIENMYFLGAAILWPALTIVSSKITKTSPMTFTLYMYVISTIIVLFFYVDATSIDYGNFDSIFWVNILSLAIISTTFATTIYFIGIEKLGANEVSSFIFLVPFAAISLSALFLNEKITSSIIIGTVLTLLAVKILNRIRLFKRAG